jgi:hypothetical protein
MNPRSHHLLAVGLTLLLGGCATTPRLSVPATPVPDLRGTWTGSWGGTPLTLFVLQQEDAGPSGGVSLGPWQLVGQPLPGLSGVLTFTVGAEAISVNVQARLGDWNGRLTLVLEPLTPNGEQIILTHVDEHRMTGRGTSRVNWEPQGPVELVRQALGGSGEHRP